MLIVGHPFIDIWAAVKPERLGKKAWPQVPRNVEWKHGVCQSFGWPHRDQADIARAWKHILGGVRGFQDLDPALLGRVEELIDFVTQGADALLSWPCARPPPPRCAGLRGVTPSAARVSRTMASPSRTRPSRMCSVPM